MKEISDTQTAILCLFEELFDSKYKSSKENIYEALLFLAKEYDVKDVKTLLDGLSHSHCNVIHEYELKKG